jgi:hypothetical protein
LCADALLSRLAVIVSGARPAAERAWLMSARTWAADVPGEVPAEPVADLVGDGAGLDDAETAGDGRACGRFVRAVDDGDGGGTLATAARKGRPAQDAASAADAVDPADAASAGAGGVHEAGVGRTVTVPAAGEGAGPGLRAR